MFRLSERHEYHSLEQIAFVHQLSGRRDLKPREALYAATQLVNHGLASADEFLNKLKLEIPSKAAHDYLNRLKKRNRMIQSLPMLDAFRADTQIVEELYRGDGFVFRQGTHRHYIAVVVFTTVFNNFTFSNLVMDAILAQLGVSRLFLKDTSSFAYFKGVEGLCGNLAELPGALNQLLLKYGVRKQILAGYSSGGYPSLYAANRISNIGYVGYSIHTNISAESSLPMRPMYDRNRSQVEASLFKDLKVELNNKRNTCLIHYGKRDPVDAAHAQHLQGADGVEIMCHDTAGHEVTAQLLEEEIFLWPFIRLLDVTSDHV